MDAPTQDQQQKDFMATYFPPSSDHNQNHGDPSQQQQILFPGLQPNTLGSAMHPSFNGSNTTMPFDIEALGSLMQGIEGQAPLSPNQQAASYNPHMMLEQQFKLTQLQQLQQLQNQIFQQQMALISGQSAGQVPDVSTGPQRPQNHSGLPTPGPSSELRPQMNNEYVSPMILQYTDTPQEHIQNDMPHPHHSHIHGTSSAPASIAFRQNSVPLSTGDLDFDISPLTSPWLGANQYTAQSRVSQKRTASLSGDEDSSKPARKRQSPAIRASNPAPIMKKSTRASKSTTSTPLMRSTRSRKNSTVAEGDTPSPVDLSMPPPAPPSNQIPSSSLNSNMPISPRPDLQLTPVTPASIMNLGRLGLSSGLSPIAQNPTSAKKDIKGKNAAKPKNAGESSGTRKPMKKNSSLPLTNPSLKPIRPAGDASSIHVGPSASNEEPPRKTSHKAAEQKRRDSLKTTFDDLRHLLPPVPLPSDENFPDEPLLPGALPPRGPPKAGGEGPNKGVSKLQLLRCGNDFIRQLKGRVERRDEEIDKLRREVLRLRDIAGHAAAYAEEDLDLERDLDAMEALTSGYGRLGGSANGDDDADDEDGD